MKTLLERSGTDPRARLAVEMFASRCVVRVVVTDEDLVIARHARRLVR